MYCSVPKTGPLRRDYQKLELREELRWVLYYTAHVQLRKCKYQSCHARQSLFRMLVDAATIKFPR